MVYHESPLLVLHHTHTHSHHCSPLICVVAVVVVDDDDNNDDMVMTKARHNHFNKINSKEHFTPDYSLHMKEKHNSHIYRHAATEGRRYHFTNTTTLHPTPSIYYSSYHHNHKKNRRKTTNKQQQPCTPPRVKVKVVPAKRARS